MQVPFGISGAFYKGSDRELNAETLRILLDALIALNRAYLRTIASNGKRMPHLYESGVRYGRTLVWDTIPDLYVNGVGDCKSLTAAFCAQALEAGQPCRPAFRYSFRVHPDPAYWRQLLHQTEARFGVASDEYKYVAKQNDGGLDYHILVETNGKMRYRGRLLDRYHDPSKVLGMTDDMPQ